MNKINYQLELDREIDEIKKQGRVLNCPKIYRQHKKDSL